MVKSKKKTNPPKKHSNQPRKPRGPVTGPVGPGNRRFRKWFRHYITGEIYYAEDYGHDAWPIG